MVRGSGRLCIGKGDELRGGGARVVCAVNDARERWCGKVRGERVSCLPFPPHSLRIVRPVPIHSVPGENLGPGRGGSLRRRQLLRPRPTLVKFPPLRPRHARPLGPQATAHPIQLLRAGRPHAILGAGRAGSGAEGAILGAGRAGSGAEGAILGVGRASPGAGEQLQVALVQEGLADGRFGGGSRVMDGERGDVRLGEGAKRQAEVRGGAHIRGRGDGLRHLEEHAGAKRGTGSEARAWGWGWVSGDTRKERSTPRRPDSPTQKGERRARSRPAGGSPAEASRRAPPAPSRECGGG
eukprot:scaffold16571_cov122-Isochrysis_galbana.AAC.2